MSDRQREVKVMASEIKRETVVSIKNAYLRYASEKGSVTALENVNLEIEKGEFICVLGPSGCGKSTLRSGKRCKCDVSRRPPHCFLQTPGSPWRTPWQLPAVRPAAF